MQPPLTYIGVFFLSLLLFCIQAFAVEEEDDAYPEQDFLFFLEEAYTQDQGEWQFSLAAGYFDNLLEEETDGQAVSNRRTDLWLGLLGVEYGITNRLQIEFELPYLRQEIEEDEATGGDRGVGDVEFVLGYALIEEGSGSPQLTAGLEIIAPTGDEDAGLGAGAWGWGPFLALSKQVVPKWYLHANLALQMTNDAEEGGEKKDERELELSLIHISEPTRPPSTSRMPSSA
mgnify:FL=1